MQILVTGGTGFIGGHLIRTLRAEHEVSCLTRQPRPDAALDGIRCIVADLNTEGWEESLPEQMDVVIHLAQANAPFPGSADELFRVNVLSTQRLADYARRAGVSRFVYASSGSVYAPSAELLSETSRLAPGEFYGVTKHCSEQVLESYTAYFDLSLLRLFVPYGPGQRGRMIPNIAKAVREGRPVVLVNGGHPYVNPVFIDDVVAVMRQALRRPGTHVLNVAGPESISVREIATIAGTLVGREPVFEEGSEAPASDLLADITALRSRFAIPDLVGPVEGIRRLLEADDLHDRREAPPLLGRGEMCPARVS